MKKRFVLMFAFMFLVIGMRSADSFYIEGDFWSINDDTLVTSNTTHHVLIGENATTTYKLEVNGISNFKDDLRIQTNKKILLPDLLTFISSDGLGTMSITAGSFIDLDGNVHINDELNVIGNTDVKNLDVGGQLTLLDVLTDIIIDGTPGGDTHIEIPVPIGGVYTISFPVGTYDVVSTINAQTITGQKTFSNRDTFFSEDLIHTNNPDTKITFDFNRINFLAGNVRMISLVENLIATDTLIFNENGALMDILMETPFISNAFHLIGSTQRLEINVPLDVSEDTLFLENVDIKESLTVTENISGNFFYGEMFFHNDNVANVTVIDTVDKWFNISAFDQLDNGTSLNGFDYDDDNLTCLVDGFYKVDYSITVSGSANNKYHFAVGINGMVQQGNTESHIKVGSVNDIAVASGTGFIRLDINDRITLQVLNEDGANDVNVFSANLNLVRIGN